jgi:ABC-type dipeptide/oligopeptide/nickel transport system permease subunit
VSLDVRVGDLSLQEPDDEPKREGLGAMAWLCLGFVVLLAVIAVMAPLLAPYDPYMQVVVDSNQGPSRNHLLGTDELGRDIWSQLLFGTRTALVGPLIVAIGAGLLGTFLGLLAGFRGGWVDGIAMRSTEIIYAVPPLIVAIVLVGILGGGYWLAVLVLVFLAAPADVRVVRSAVMAQMALPYVSAARTVGLSGARVATRHVLPNITPTVTANVLLQFVGALVALSGLAFLGLGVSPGTPDWGLMIAENRSNLDINPLAVIAPALLITVLAIAVTIIGDRVFDRLSVRRGIG